MPIAIIAAIGVSTAIGAYGAHKTGQAGKAVGESQAQQHEFNARVADLNAYDAGVRGAEAETKFRTSVRGLIGGQRAGFAGQGVEVGSGSAADVQADAAYLGELDARTIRHNSEREAWGFEVEAADRRLAADVARRGGQAGATAGNIQAVNTVVGGVMQAGMVAQKYGMFGLK